MKRDTVSAYSRPLQDTHSTRRTEHYIKKKQQLKQQQQNHDVVRVFLTFLRWKSYINKRIRLLLGVSAIRSFHSYSVFSSIVLFIWAHILFWMVWICDCQRLPSSFPSWVHFESLDDCSFYEFAEQWAFVPWCSIEIFVCLSSIGVCFHFQYIGIFESQVVQN